MYTSWNEALPPTPPHFAHIFHLQLMEMQINFISLSSGTNNGIIEFTVGVWIPIPIDLIIDTTQLPFEQ